MNTDEHLDEISKKLDKCREQSIENKYESRCYILGGFTLAMVSITGTNPLLINIVITIAFFIILCVMLCRWRRFRRAKAK